MSQQVAGLIDGKRDVDRARARTEVAAKAFAEAAGGYFERLAAHEDDRDAARERQERMKRIGAGAVVAGLVLVVLGVVLGDGPTLPVIGLGLLVALAGAGYAYTQYTDAVEAEEAAEQRIAENEPDGTVSFVSQVTVPFYLVPFGDRHVIFDGLDAAPTRRLELANLDGVALRDAEAEFDAVYDLLDDHLDDASVLTPEAAEELVPDLAEHRRLERPLVERAERMTGIANDVDHETVVADVHANDAKAESMRTLAAEGLLGSADDLPEVETTRSMAESRAVVETLQGVEEQARSGDILDQAQAHREHVNEALTETASRLQENTEVLDDHYAAHADVTDAATHKRVCPDCLESGVGSVREELNLVDRILGAEGGSLGRALSDEDLDRGTDEAFTEQIRADVEAELPQLDDDLAEALAALPDLGDAGYCASHGDVEPVAVPESGALFGEVWRSLYYRFRDPIQDSVDELESQAEDLRQNKDQQMMDLTQYEQIKDDVEQRYYEVKTDYEAARSLERRLG